MVLSGFFLNMRPNKLSFFLAGWEEMDAGGFCEPADERDMADDSGVGVVGLLPLSPLCVDARRESSEIWLFV